jgi:N-acetylglucosamine kinase-like BadF-type ATPase
MSYLLGIDAGGTGVSCIAFSLSGDELGVWRAGPGNPTANGLNLAVTNICLAIDAAQADLGPGCLGMLAGVAGAAAGGLREQLDLELAIRYRFPVEVIGDAEMVLEARLTNRDGVIVIAGTGSIAWGRKGSEIARYGGWGHLIGDEGSGYGIAINALKAMFRDEDEGKPRQALSQALLYALQAADLREVIELIYSHDKATVAALLPVIAAQADEGERRAQDLLANAGEDLAVMALTCSKRLDLAEPEIAVSGSVLIRVDRVREHFERAILSACPAARLNCDRRPVNRAVLSWYERRAGFDGRTARQL